MGSWQSSGCHSGAPASAGSTSSSAPSSRSSTGTGGAPAAPSSTSEAAQPTYSSTPDLVGAKVTYDAADGSYTSQAYLDEYVAELNAWRATDKHTDVEVLVVPLLDGWVERP